MDFQNTMPLPPMAAAPAAPAAARMRADAPRGGGESLPLQFTGSGSEYFRIWIVNLLLTIVTLGFYHPFAKVRRLRYFHGNTLVGGHALGFHGDPWKMLRGYVLMLVFGAVYVGAGQFSALAGAIAGAAFALLWPALWQSSLRFRLANTSWRGLRMRFSGDLAGAYRAMLPLLLPLAVMLLTSAGVGQPGPKPSMLRLTVAGLSTVALMLLVPWTLARIKRYQHGHYELAGERTELDARTRSFYGWAVGTLLVSLVPLALVFAGLFLIAPSNAGRIGGDVMLRNSGLFVLLLLAGYLAMFLVSQSWSVARLQNLVWSHTRSPRLRFRSRLGTLAMMGMLLKNLVLTVITLGLYRPFAVVAMTRLRLHAVGIDAAGDIEQWSAAAIARGTPEAAGDAAGDLLGIDIGL